MGRHLHGGVHPRREERLYAASGFPNLQRRTLQGVYPLKNICAQRTAAFDLRLMALVQILQPYEGGQVGGRFPIPAILCRRT